MDTPFLDPLSPSRPIIVTVRCLSKKILLCLLFSINEWKRTSRAILPGKIVPCFIKVVYLQPTYINIRCFFFL